MTIDEFMTCAEFVLDLRDDQKERLRGLLEHVEKLHEKANAAGLQSSVAAASVPSKRRRKAAGGGERG